jgi:hypothetical protein
MRSLQSQQRDHREASSSLFLSFRKKEGRSREAAAAVWSREAITFIALKTFLEEEEI